MRLTIGLVAWMALATGCGVFGTSADEAAPAAAQPAPAPPPRKDEPGPPKPPSLQGTPTESDLVESRGVFVTEKGSDDGDGTRLRPFGSIAKGIAQGRASGKHVYVCQGTFHEAITLEDGIAVIGGLDCSRAEEWKAGAGRSRLEAPASPAVRAANVTSPTRFERFEVIAPDAAQPSGSSIAFIADKSPGLTIADSRIVAGNGASGKPGTEGIQLVQTGLIDGVAGIAAGPYCQLHANRCELNLYTAVNGPRGGRSTCSGAAGHDGEPGGNGGSGGVYQSQNGLLGYSWQVYTGVGATPSGALPGGPGSGAAGSAGQNGASANGVGALGADGYAPADGTKGTDGEPGKGGSGTAGTAPLANPSLYRGEIWSGEEGSGGGAGGCPGLAGTPGKGGGASIALLLVESPIAISQSEIRSAGGGAGGRGSLGSTPTPGGAGAKGAANGGNGGASGVSGSGGGGPSFAIAHTGGAPKLASTTAKAGHGGAGVPEETTTDALGNAKTLPASAAGATEDVHAF